MPRPAIVSIDLFSGMMRVYCGRKKIDAVQIDNWSTTPKEDRGLDPIGFEKWRSTYDKPTPGSGPGTPDGARTAVAA